MRSPLHNLVDATKPHEVCYDKDQNVIKIEQDGVDVLKLDETQARARARALNRRERLQNDESAVAAQVAAAREGGGDEDDPPPGFAAPKDARQTLIDAGILKEDRRNVRAPKPEAKPEPAPVAAVAAAELAQGGSQS